MQNDGEAGEQLADFLENIEAQLGLCARLELVGAVACANGDSKGIHARFSNELVDFFGASIGGIFLLDFQLILNTCKPAQLAFYNDAAIVRIFDYFFGERDVLLKRQVRAIDHNRSEAAVDAAFAGLERIAMIKMQADGKPGIFDSSLNQFCQIDGLCIVARALGYLKNQRSIFLFGRFRNPLDNFHVIDVESADGISALVCLLKHLCSCN